MWPPILSKGRQSAFQAVQCNKGALWVELLMLHPRHVVHFPFVERPVTEIAGDVVRGFAHLIQIEAGLGQLDMQRGWIRGGGSGATVVKERWLPIWEMLCAGNHGATCDACSGSLFLGKRWRGVLQSEKFGNPSLYKMEKLIQWSKIKKRAILRNSILPHISRLWHGRERSIKFIYLKVDIAPQLLAYFGIMSKVLSTTAQ